MCISKGDKKNFPVYRTKVSIPEWMRGQLKLIIHSFHQAHISKCFCLIFFTHFHLFPDVKVLYYHKCKCGVPFWWAFKANGCFWVLFELFTEIMTLSPLSLLWTALKNVFRKIFNWNWSQAGFLNKLIVIWLFLKLYPKFPLGTVCLVKVNLFSHFSKFFQKFNRIFFKF